MKTQAPMDKPYYKTIKLQGIDFRFRITTTQLESGTIVFCWSLENPYGEGTLEEDTSWSAEELGEDLQASAKFALRRLS